MATIHSGYQQPVFTNVYERLIKSADTNGDKRLNRTELDTFQQYIMDNKDSNRWAQARKEKALGDLISHFDIFDSNGDGEIDRADIRRVAATDNRAWDISKIDLKKIVNHDDDSYAPIPPPHYQDAPAPETNKLGKLLKLLLPFILIMLLGGDSIRRY